ncbi:hypothetical protein K438DRAFT_1858611 [Mycena galopus ATCC 62051]|nr:hypothetical protein K438DRAFT_1858611 [Mycena galopus ATCC 62051]
MDSSALLRLDDTTLMFFPPQTRAGGALKEPTVVQVTMKRASTRSSTSQEVAGYYDAQTEITEVAGYYDAQKEITIAVETLVLENLIEPLRNNIEIPGDGYMLVGQKKEWVYGRGLLNLLKWGDEEVRAGADKWVFYFRKGIEPNDPKAP